MANLNCIINRLIGSDSESGILGLLISKLFEVKKDFENEFYKSKFFISFGVIYQNVLIDLFEIGDEDKEKKIENLINKNRSLSNLNE